MAAVDYFDAPVAYNPDADALVANAVFQVFATTDATFTTPLAVTDPVSGTAITELRSSSIGVLPSFKIAGAPAQVVLKSGTFVTLLTSRFGLLREGGFDAAVVAGAMSDFATIPTRVQSAIELANIPGAIADLVDGAGVPRSEHVDTDLFEVRFDDGTPFIRADEARGIFSKITHLPTSVPPAATTFVIELPRESGWDWGIITSDNHMVFGQRVDGTMYPPIIAEGAVKTYESEITGDSIAASWAAYAAALGTQLGVSVTNQGIGGQRSPQIAARQGGVPALVTVTGNSIPASGSVNVTAVTEIDGTALSPLLLTSNGTKTMTVVVAGVACTLTGVTTSGVVAYTLTRLTAGVAVPCPPGSPMTTGHASRNRIPILLGPRNDLGNTTADAFREPLADIVARYKAMLAWSYRGSDAIILSVLPRTDVTGDGAANLVILNNGLRDAFPTNYVDFGAWLRSPAAATAAGITFTTDDNTAIANNTTPPSFLSDGFLHLNASGYAAANALIDNVYRARGWKV